MEYLEAFQDVNVIRSVNKGRHAREADAKKSGMLDSIPNIGYLAVGCMVRLTCNICPELWLANGSRGTVRDIVVLFLFILYLYMRAIPHRPRSLCWEYVSRNDRCVVRHPGIE
eukprot:SAG31_NODE_4947_length_2843_cov_1.582362_1_plen_113_part_00